MPNQQSGESGPSSNKRRILQGLGGATAASLAGCFGGSDDEDSGGEEDPSGGDEFQLPEPNPDAATNWDNYSVTELAVDETMMSLDVAPDGRVFYITRGALFGAEATTGTSQINYVDPESGETGTALELDVNVTDEDGGQGITFDPDFEENGWVYVFYVPTDEDLDDPDNPYMLVSRFTMDGDTIDPGTETEIIRIPHQRETCCHVGGYLEFGPEGNLYISTGDDTNPFESDGYSPLDGREGRKNFDSRRTAGNTADLRGSVLRITPQDDGSYTIPDGNLFPEDEYADEIDWGMVKPEIYVMGLRNPYTLAVDDETGDLHIADYGPDADSWDASRGPVGIVEYRRVCEAQNAGWPFARGYFYPYRRYDFESGEAGQPYWPDNLVNDSPHNDGLEEIPSMTPADIWYPINWEGYLEAPDWVDVPKEGEQTFDLPAGGAPMTGPRYRYKEGYGQGALDTYFHGKQFIMDWGNNYIKTVTYNDDGGVEFEDFLPNVEFQSPNDMAVGPDGRLFLQTYGPPWAGEEGRVYMIEYEG